MDTYLDICIHTGQYKNLYFHYAADELLNYTSETNDALYVG